MKLWIKLILCEKVVKNTLFDVQDDFDGLTEDLRVVCEALDIPTPMLLKSRYDQLMNFNMLKLTESDFIESIFFDIMYIENCVSPDKQDTIKYKE
ncbi:MAG: hypothetical protein LBT30_03090 [Clostridiales bacterium]|jgi:hypothetical protein|nr:hypothetical protein [Clostridiales bacterium]